MMENITGNRCSRKLDSKVGLALCSPRFAGNEVNVGEYRLYRGTVYPPLCTYPGTDQQPMTKPRKYSYEESLFAESENNTRVMCVCEI